MLAILLVALAAASGTGAQVTTGFGQGLLLAPVLQIAAPGAGSVRLVNALGILLNGVVLARHGRQVHRRAAVLLVVPALAATLLLEAVLGARSATVVAVLAAGATLVAVGLTALNRTPRVLTGRVGAVLAGLLCGVLTASSGTGGPPVAAHVASRRWSRESLVPTVQAVFLPANVAAVINGHGAPSTALLAATVAGTGFGYLVAARHGRSVRPGAVRAFVLVTAAVGSLLVIGHGLLGR